VVSMNVLLSVKPKYAAKIVKGEKKYEFRKRIFTRKDIEQIYIYSTSLVSKIIGAITIKGILEGSPAKIWGKCSFYSGMTEEEYFCYFKDKENTFAIEIKDVKVFTEIVDPYMIFDKFIPPQSFCYFDDFPFQEKGENYLWLAK
jgi:type I restriction enzyme S subunit